MVLVLACYCCFLFVSVSFFLASFCFPIISVYVVETKHDKTKEISGVWFLTKHDKTKEISSVWFLFWFVLFCYVLCILCLHLVILFCQMRRRWTTEDDRQLCDAVCQMGTGDWDRISREFFSQGKKWQWLFSVRWHRDLRPKPYKVRYLLYYTCCTVVEANSNSQSLAISYYRTLYLVPLFPARKETDQYWRVRTLTQTFTHRRLVVSKWRL